MTGVMVHLQTSPDGTLVIRPHDILHTGDAGELRRTLVHALYRLRPRRLVLDLHGVRDLDSINLGVLAAACDLGEDHQVTVFLDHSNAIIAEQLTAAGVPYHRLRHIDAGEAAPPAG
jgi:anti-anti-sigma factor